MLGSMVYYLTCGVLTVPKGIPNKRYTAEFKKLAEKLTQAARYERSEARQGYRSGHYDRNLTTSSGDVTFHVSRPIGGNCGK